MIERIGAWLAPNGRALFNTGPAKGISIDSYQGQPLYHESLSPQEYRAAFVRAEPVTNLLFAARADHMIRDASASPANAITTVWVAGGYRPLPPLEGFLTVARSLPTRLARAEVPGVDSWELRLVTRVVF
jgi:hypothetical protein